MTFFYDPSDASGWLAVATGGRVLLAEVSDDPERVKRFAATLAEDTSVQDVLDTLTAQGLSATGHFALVFWVDGSMGSQGLGVIVRGGARVVVDTDDGDVQVSSRGVTTWSEQVIEGATGFIVCAPDADADGTPLLPLVAGAVWAERVSFSHTGAESAVADAVDATEVPTSSAGTPAPAEAPAAEAEPRRALVVPIVVPPDLPDVSLASVTPIEDAPSVTPAAADGYDYLFDATIVQGSGDEPAADALVAVPPLAVPAAEVPQGEVRQGEASGPQRTSHDTLGDHDGRTILSTEISDARRAARSTPEHPSIDVAEQAYDVLLPDGTRQPLTAPVIFGRAPSVSHVPASGLPHLVTVTGDDISRSHVRIAVEGGTIVVTDLQSSNGTHVLVPGAAPRLLRGGEPTPVIVGTEIDLGSGVVLRVIEA